MSDELTDTQLNQAFAAIDTAYNAVDVARDKAIELRGHIDWQAEQIAERDAEIDRLGDHIVSLQESFDAVSSQEDR